MIIYLIKESDLSKQFSIANVPDDVITKLKEESCNILQDMGASKEVIKLMADSGFMVT